MDCNNPFRDRGYWDNPNNEKVLCLNVTRTSFSGERPNLYECTRKYWKLNGERAAKADLVFAVIIGTIVGVSDLQNGTHRRNIPADGNLQVKKSPTHHICL